MSDGSLRHVTWTDPEGRKFKRLLPSNAPDSDAEWGIPLGPPSLKGLGLPAEIEIRLHNELFARGLYTEASIRRRNDAIVAALQAAFKIDAGRIAEVYRRGTSEELTADARSSPT